MEQVGGRGILHWDLGLGREVCCMCGVPIRYGGLAAGKGGTRWACRNMATGSMEEEENERVDSSIWLFTDRHAVIYGNKNIEKNSKRIRSWC